MSERLGISDNLLAAIIIVASLVSCPFIINADRGNYARCLEAGWSPVECEEAPEP